MDGKNRMEYPTFISTCQRYGLSDRAISHILNSVMVDLNIEDFVSVTKVRRMKRTYGMELVKEHSKIEGLEVLGFDGKRSDVALPNSKTANLDKITVIEMASKDYIAHFIPEVSNGEKTAAGLYEASISAIY